MCSTYNAFENVPYSLENDIVKSEQLDQLLDQLPLFVINEVEKSIFRCYQLKYFWSKLIQLFTFHSVSIIDCIKTDIYLQTFKTFTLYKSVQSKNYSNTFYEAHIYNTL